MAQSSCIPCPIPTHRTRGLRRLGKQPTVSTAIRNGGCLAVSFATMLQTPGICRSSTSPKNRSVTCRFSGSTHFTCVPVRASFSCSWTKRSRIALPTSAAMKVRKRAMVGWSWIALKAQHFPVLLQALVDLVPFETLESVQAEILHGKACNDCAVSHRPAKPARRRAIVRCQGAQQAARETIASARWIEDIVRGIGRHHENPVLREKHGPMFALLD